MTVPIEILSKNDLLIAMPSLSDPIFKRAVVYICEHQEQGTIGLIINKPLEFSLKFIFEQLSIQVKDNIQETMPVLLGGPLQMERGFVVHKPFGRWRSSLILQEDVIVTTSNDIIHALANNIGPKEVLVTLGYSGWASNQLEQEVIDNKWLICPYQPALLFEIPFDERWHYAGLSIGVDMNQIVPGEGHA